MARHCVRCAAESRTLLLTTDKRAFTNFELMGTRPKGRITKNYQNKGEDIQSDWNQIAISMT